MSPLSPQLSTFRTHEQSAGLVQGKQVALRNGGAGSLRGTGESIGQALGKIAPMLNVIAKRHGGSVMRIYKDTRFSKDKTPYKTSVGISFRHDADGTIHAPGVYLHLDPLESFLGVGCWRPERTALTAIRDAIAEDPGPWHRAVRSKRFGTHYHLSGDSLKTAPRGIPKDHLKSRIYVASISSVFPLSASRRSVLTISSNGCSLGSKQLDR